MMRETQRTLLKISAGETEIRYPLVTLASLEEYARKQSARTVSRLLLLHSDGAGRHAPAGLKKYLFNGKMTGGFAIAHSARYRFRGDDVHSERDGIVTRKISPNTVSKARTLSLYDPDTTWKR